MPGQAGHDGVGSRLHEGRVKPGMRCPVKPVMTEAEPGMTAFVIAGLTGNLVFAPDHFVDYANVALDYADDFGGDVLVHIVGDGNAGQAVTNQ